jgi:hypothetical protein
MELHPDVLVYLQSVKTYLENNTEAREYFIGDSDEESFLDLVSDVANVNYEKRGEPQLTKAQFEFVRITLRAFTQSETQDDSIYEYIPNHINFYLK